MGAQPTDPATPRSAHQLAEHYPFGRQKPSNQTHDRRGGPPDLASDTHCDRPVQPGDTSVDAGRIDAGRCRQIIKKCKAASFINKVCQPSDARPVIRSDSTESWV